MSVFQYQYLFDLIISLKGRKISETEFFPQKAEVIRNEGFLISDDSS